MEWIALAIILAGWWISNAISDVAHAADQINDTIERLIWDDLQSEEE